MPITDLSILMWVIMEVMVTVASSETAHLEKNFMEGNLDLPPPKRIPGWPVGGALPHCFVGDKAFPLRMDLMRPFPEARNRSNFHTTR